ncbi:MAG: hypothetical protein HUJ61_02895, partial [Bacilli bacterium]|nr:hypothetical protein [Bacilli bacterium]
MKKIDLGAIAISALICLISFLASNSLIIALATLVIYIAYYFLVLRKKLKNYLITKEKIYSCSHFISSFLTTLSSKESLEEAFQSGTRKTNDEFATYLVQLEDMNINEKIDYLKHYFKFNLYKMFLKVVNLYQDQGGNVLKISD